MRRANELKEFLITSKMNTSSVEGKLAFAMQSLMKLLEKKGEPVQPHGFIEVCS